MNASIETFTKVEDMFEVKCDVHPWMKSYIGVVGHPYFDVTAENGAYEISGLPAGRPSALRDLIDAFAYVWRTPQLLAGMALALLVNFCAFPLTGGVLPYVAREVYRTDQTGLGYLAASFAFGALVGSLALSRNRRRIRSGRMMIIFTAGWFAMLLVFAWVDVMAFGIVWIVK